MGLTLSIRTHAERGMHGCSVLPKTTGVLALVFLLFAFVGQAFHSHLTVQSGAQATGGAVLRAMAADSATTDDGSAETCPLCVAMHSATPSKEAASAVGFQVVVGQVAGPAEVFREERVAFARLSRPPPAL